MQAFLWGRGCRLASAGFLSGITPVISRTWPCANYFGLRFGIWQIKLHGSKPNSLALTSTWVPELFTDYIPFQLIVQIIFGHSVPLPEVILNFSLGFEMSTDPAPHASIVPVDPIEPHSGHHAEHDASAFSPVRVKRYRNNPLGPGRAAASDLIVAVSNFDQTLGESVPSEHFPSPVCSQSFATTATPKSSAASGSWSVVASLHPGTILECPASKSHPLPAPNRTLSPRTRPSVALVPSATPLPAPTRLNIHRACLPSEAHLPSPIYQSARAYSTYPSEAYGTQVFAPLQEGARTVSEAEPPCRFSFVRPSPKGPAALKSGDHIPALCPEAAAIASNLGGVVLQRTLHSEAWDAILLLWRSLVDIIGPHSSVLRQLQGSPNGPALTLNLLQLNADTTALRYVKACLAYFEFLIDLGHSLDNLSQLAAVETVYALHCSRSQDDDFSLDREQIALVFPLNTLKALRWLVKTVTLHFPDLYTQACSELCLLSHLQIVLKPCHFPWTLSPFLSRSCLILFLLLNLPFLPALHWYVYGPRCALGTLPTYPGQLFCLTLKL